MLSRAELLTLTGISEPRFAALKLREQFPVFTAAPEALEEETPRGVRRFRTWDAWGLMLLVMATEDGVEGGALPEAMVKLVGAPHPGRTQASDAARLLRAAERPLSLHVPSILHAEPGAPDVHIACAMVAQPAPHEPNPKTELAVGTLAEIVVAAERNPIVGRGPRTVLRLFTVNASEAWRRIRDRADAAGIDLGA
jgi:hypothetical protein